MSLYNILKVLKWIYCLIDRLSDRLVGYSLSLGWQEERSKAKSYGYSAHLLKIALRAKELPFETAIPENNFLLIHSEYVHPSYVMQDFISLMGVTDDSAFFAVIPRAVDIYSSEVHPFMYVAQFDHATHVIVMPMTSFHRLAEEIGEPEVQVVLLSNTGRCGSTIAAQVFETIPNALVMSEPDAFTLALMMHNTGKTTNEQDELILKSIMSLQCKNLKSKKVELMVLKTRGRSVQQIRKISSCSKFAKHVFMYRHPKGTILSFLSMIGLIKLLNLRKMMANLMSFPETRAHRSITRSHLYETLTTDGLVALSWALKCISFLEYRSEGVEIHPLRYEDLLKNPSETVSALFSHLNIPQKHVPQALAALEKDSQRGSVLGRGEVAKTKVVDFTPEQHKQVDYVFREVGFPSIEEFVDLPDWNQERSSSFWFNVFDNTTREKGE